MNRPAGGRAASAADQSLAGQRAMAMILVPGVQPESQADSESVPISAWSRKAGLNIQKKSTESLRLDQSKGFPVLPVITVIEPCKLLFSVTRTLNFE